MSSERAERVFQFALRCYARPVIPRSPFSLAAVAALALVACNKTEPRVAPQPQPAVAIGAVPSPSSSASTTPAVAVTPPVPAEPLAASTPPSPPAPEDVSAPPSSAKTTASGLAYRVLTPGTGTEHPSAQSQVTVNYSGWTADGHLFDSSIPRGEPASFPLNGVIKGWTEALQLMVVGEKSRFWVPPNLAYGEHPTYAGAPSGQLTFDIELVQVTEPPQVPKDVKTPPKSAKKTASGLAYRVLTPGTGSEHPTATSRVTVHYSGWTANGKMFDSSVSRGQPVTLPLNSVIPGWREGLQLMVVGEKSRFWMPAKLAYGERPLHSGAPSGQLTFDVELIEILP